MSDPNAPAASPAPAQIQVRASAAAIIVPDVFRVAVVAGFAMLAARYVKNEQALGLVLPAGAYLATAGWSLWQRLKAWRALKFLAGQVPDSVAVVGKPT